MTQEAHYYDGGGHLVQLERHNGWFGNTDNANDPAQVIESYRYDALGRRVLVHTLHDPSCIVKGCESSVERFVWAGPQLVAEVRGPASAAASDATVESDTPGGNGEHGMPEAYGRVVYTLAGGLDRPLGLIRINSTYTVYAALYPQVNWRGLYVTATTESGAQYADAKFVAFAGARASVDLGQQVPGDTALYWMGSLVAEQQDASGLLYRRHRYYDPASGRFTQPDPIGIAGGLNSYAYANGDPVNNRDPFGLCPKDVGGDGKSERLDDCEKGTSGYYAYTVAEGEGTVVNTVLGLGASCGESAYCEGAAIALAATTVGMVAGAGEALGLNQYLRAGMRTFRGQREFRISGRILDWLTRKEGTHWTSAKVLEAIKNLIK